MLMRAGALLAVLVATCGLSPTAPDPYQIFANAQTAWEAYAYPRYVAYDVVVAVTQRGVVSSAHYHLTYDARDEQVVTSGMSDEELAHPYVPHGINTSINLLSGFLVIPLSAPQRTFDFLGVPRLSPLYSFGIARTTSIAGPLQGAALVQKIRKEFNDPAPRRSRVADVAGPLKVIASVESTRRRYVITFAGIDAVNGHSDYHLLLLPSASPYVYRLRELWVNSHDFSVDKLIVQGNFREGGMDSVRWLVTYNNGTGAPPYVASEKSLSGFSFDRRRYDEGVITFANVREVFAMPLEPQLRLRRHSALDWNRIAHRTLGSAALRSTQPRLMRANTYALSRFLVGRAIARPSSLIRGGR